MNEAYNLACKKHIYSEHELVKNIKILLISKNSENFSIIYSFDFIHKGTLKLHQLELIINSLIILSKMMHN